jgi:hypothetical protein
VRGRRDQVVLGAVAAAVLGALVAFAVAGGGVEHGTATPTPPPREGAERPLFGGSLAPHVRYRTRFFVPALSFAVADADWLAQGTTQPDRLLLVRRRGTGAPGGELDPRAYLSFSRSTLAPGRVRLAMRHDPGLVVGRSRAVTVAATPAETFPVRLRYRDQATSCRRLLLVCTTIPPGAYLVPGTRMRRIVLMMASGALVIDVIGATRRDLASVEGPAMAVVRTLRTP